MDNVRKYVLAALMIGSAILTYAYTPTQYMAINTPMDLERAIPMEFGDWKMAQEAPVIVESPEREAAVKSVYSQVVSRVYRNTIGEQIMLSVAYTDNQSDNSGKQSHKPEICYPAQGFKILQNNRGELTTDMGVIPVKRLLTVSGVRSEPLTYWSTIGRTVPVGELQVKLAQIRYGFSGQIPDGVVFRVSSLSNEPVKAYRLQQSFVNALTKSLTPSNRERLTSLGVAH